MAALTDLLNNDAVIINLVTYRLMCPLQNGYWIAVRDVDVAAGDAAPLYIVKM